MEYILIGLAILFVLWVLNKISKASAPSGYLKPSENIKKASTGGHIEKGWSKINWKVNHGKACRFELKENVYTYNVSMGYVPNQAYIEVEVTKSYPQIDFKNGKNTLYSGKGEYAQTIALNGGQNQNAVISMISTCIERAENIADTSAKPVYGF